MPAKKPAIIVHGGAGDWPTELHMAATSGTAKAAGIGFDVLLGHGSALDAVQAAVVSLEDNPIFNAGTGSTLNLLGEIETDAAIMDGRTLRAGAVALLKRIRNPIKAARVVMEQTDHVLIAGRAAERLAMENGLPTANLKVPRRIAAWRRGVRELKSKPRSRISARTIDIFTKKRMDTVGALAIDEKGHLAAADSTGGVSLKLPGRIGDSPILGAGLYADDRSGAATATGLGEQAMRLVISKMACDLMTRKTAAEAARSTIRYATKRLGRGTGLLTLDHRGRFAVAHNTRYMSWASKDSNGALQGMKGPSLL
ncbi:MAG TPA: isoaspartyl peptidase/L-asparaginase [Candidatus Bathyarchaeia archaeon]|nr:isoaspartyl peptidase/L-asparaginase [Candidatus Bathyarchaeia archaeon]